MKNIPKIVMLNTTNYGSTGRIMNQIADAERQAGGIVYTFVRGWKNQEKETEYSRYVGSFFSNGIHCAIGKPMGLNGFLSVSGTLKLIRFIKKNNIDLIHIHNLHAYCYNLPLLLQFLKKSEIKVIWTLHDCWTFTGYCTHFALMGCDKWRTKCYNCKQERDAKIFNSCSYVYKKKKNLFSSFESLTIVSPSEWLAGLARESFLKGKDIRIINNGIDLSIFKPIVSDVRERLGIKNKYVVLGVCFDWSYKKGLDVFIKLSEMLSDKYQIILVGTNDEVDKDLPKSIISIHSTNSQEELAELYSCADVFANPTREDIYSNVNMESLACGTPVVGFNSGGSTEMLSDLCARIVEPDDVMGMMYEIVDICENKSLSREQCVEYSKRFDNKVMLNKYIELYNEKCIKH